MKRVKKYSKLFIAAIFIFQNALAQETIKKEFTKINLSGNGKVILKQTDEPSIRIETENNNASDATTVSNGMLFIDSDDNSEIYVTVKDIEKIEISGSGKIETEGTLKANDLDLVISGIGDMEINTSAENVKALIGGKGKIELNGSANNLNAIISGSGKIEAGNFTAKNGDLIISGAGKCDVDVKENLSINISGVGSVNYNSEPLSITKNITGIGKINKGNSKNETYTVSDKSSGDTTTIKIGNKKIFISGGGSGDNDAKVEIKECNDNDEHSIVFYHRNRKTQAHWGGFELGYNTWGKKPFSTALPTGYEFLELNSGESVAVNLNFFDWNAKLSGRRLMFVTGLGISWNNWRFQGDRTLIANAPVLSANYDTIGYLKNKLTVSYVTMPLLFEFNTNDMEKKTFHVGTGIIFGYKLDSHTKQTYDINGDGHKVKLFDDFNLDPFRYDATLRVGYRGYTVFVSYGLNWLFKRNQAPELHPLTFGLTLLNW
jgi:hypothetical protein